MCWTAREVSVFLPLLKITQAIDRLCASFSYIGFDGVTQQPQEDLVRRIQNCSESVPQAERDVVVNLYIHRLAVSGYNKKQIKMIVGSGLRYMRGH